MPVKPIAPTRNRGELTTASGILLPPSAAGSALVSPLDERVQSTLANISPSWGNNNGQPGFNSGFHLTREEETQVVCWPAKGSGWDDWTMSQIVDGNVANVGIAPVVSALFSSAVHKQEAQAMNAEIILTGRTSTVARAREALSRFNDSPLGISQGLAQFVYQFLTYNRGCPIAMIPITQPSAQWAENGIQPVPILADGQKPDEAEMYYLEVDWAMVGPVVPYMPSVFDLEPTGNNEWPYWYKTEIGDKDTWVLLHNTQILPLIPGHSAKPGIGTCSAWLSTEQLAMYVLAVDAQAEQIVAAPTDGIMVVSGLSQSAQQVKDAINDSRDKGKANGRLFSKGYTVLVTKERAAIDNFSFRSAEGIDTEFIKRFEDRVATNFGMSLAELGISRPGGGFSDNTAVIRDLTADSGIGHALAQFAIAAGAMYPRVYVSVTRPNDGARVRQLDDFISFSSAVHNLPVGTLTTGEIRAMLENQVGIKIPAVDDTVTTSTSPTADTTAPEADQGGQGGGQGDNAADNAGTGQDGASTSSANNQGARRAGQLPLSAQIDHLLLGARLLYAEAFDTVEDALDSKDFTALVEALAKTLKAQYTSADVKAIVRSIKAQGIDPAEPEAIDSIIEITKKNMKKIQDVADLPALVALLLALATQGRVEAQDQAAKVDVTLTEAQQEQVDTRNKADLTKRTNQLFVKATGANTGDSQALTDQSAPQTLDEESYATVAVLTRDAMLDNPDDDGAAAAQVEADIPKMADDRAEDIGDAEAIRAFNIGMSRAGYALKATGKRWLRTISAEPRSDHLALVGEVAAFSEPFSNGENWPGELWGCKCGIELLFD